MKKILAITLSALLTMSLVAAISPINTVKAETKNLLVSVTTWVPLGQDRDGSTLTGGKQVPWMAGTGNWWGRPGNTMNSTPEYWSVVYLTVVPSGGKSTEQDKICCIRDTQGRIWFDPDGYFHNPLERQTPDPPGQCRESNFKQDTISSNNTMGPYVVGDYANFFHDEGYWFTRLGHVNGPYTFPHDFSGRCMKIGNVSLAGGGDALILADLVRASCDSSESFNLSVETDLWEGVMPATTAASIYDPSNPTNKSSQRIQKSTVLGAKSTDFQVPATTFHNIKPEYRGWLGVEIFRDDGVNNINNSIGQCFAQNLTDDYKANEACEAFVGASATGTTDNDTGLPLRMFPANFYFHDEGGPGFGCGEAIYENVNTGQDPFNNDIVNVGDVRLVDMTLNVGGSIVHYNAGSTVTAGDVDIGYILTPFSNVGYMDADNDLQFDEDEWIYQDNDTTSTITAGDTRLSTVVRQGKTYYCGSIVAGPELYIENYPVSGFTLGKNGNPRALDIEILPGEAPVTFTVDRAFQVEQTSSVTVTMRPGPEENRLAYVLLTDASGQRNVAGTLSHDRSSMVVQITPYEGSCDEFGITHPYVIELYYEKGIGNPSEEGWGGPSDGTYGYWVVPSPTNLLGNTVIPNNYDCYKAMEFEVKPEPIDFNCSITCLSNISIRYPNMTLTLNDWDNPYDVNDLNGVPISTIASKGNIIATYNATGAGVDWMFTAGDGANRYIVQVNDDGSYYVWEWADNQSPTPGIGAIGAIDQEDTVTGPLEGQRQSQGFEDLDCSERWAECDICGTGFWKLGKVTKGDIWGPFDGVQYPAIETFGVPALVSTYKTSPWAEAGGVIPVAVYPRNTSSNLQLRVHTDNALWDYNSTITHPPYFITDNAEGIDYCGIFSIGKDSSSTGSGGSGGSGGGSGGGGAGGNITDAHVNFVEFVVVDHALQYSNVNYTAGSNPVSRMPPPATQIQSPYDPVQRNLVRQFRAYPGGQTHPLRIQGSTMGDGRNAYPALWTDQFWKLGTEFVPFTDYGIFFMLVDGSGQPLSFTATDNSLKIRRIEIKGPFITPEFPMNYEDNEYNGLRGAPVRYDYSGRIVVDSTNWESYELGPNDYTRVINPGFRDRYTYGTANQRLVQNRALDYSNVGGSVFVFDEIIPVDKGVLSIEVLLADGTRKLWEDCCQEYRIQGIPVHGLHIEGAPPTIGLMSDNVIDVKITEWEDIQQNRECNDALVYAWQDRGIRSQYGSNLLEGAGDGWVTGGPTSSVGSYAAGAYSDYDDLNGDGRISFDAFETELIGSYNLATNTWVGGIIDARTFQRNGGRYVFDMSIDNGCQIQDFGWDFNGDHVIGEDEELPVHLVAYKYGDDNNDRSFAPLWQVQGNSKYYSHEVYLAGQITMRPMAGGGIPKDPNISVVVDPPILTAGVSPELVNPDTPLTLTIKDDSGRAVDLTNGGKLSDNEVMNYITQVRPDRTGQYYWTTASLSNENGTLSDNESLFGFSPVKYDFSGAKQGIYKFSGFVANDEGEITLKIRTPDYSGWGTGSIKVAKPTVEYKITNIAQDHQKTMSYPQDDAKMTALDGRIYKVTATIRDASGNLIKGTSNLPGKMGSATDFTRFTPFLVLPEGSDPDTVSYFNRMAVSVTGNVTLDMKDIAAMSTYYKTGNSMDGTSIDLKSWGTGCIYNSELAGNYYLSDFNGDGMIDYKDSLNIGSDGSATFYVFADAEFGVGGLVGANKATVLNGDVAGDVPRSQSISFNPELRYAPDGKFALDWDAMTTTYVPIVQPSIVIYEDKTGLEWGSEFLSASNYDLVQGADNVLVVKVSPSSTLEDDPIKEGGIIEVAAKGSSKSVTEETTRDLDDPVSTTATVHFEPKTLGESTVTLSYKTSAMFDEKTLSTGDAVEFDTVKGAVISVEYSGTFYPGLAKKITVNAELAGSYGKPLVGITVSVQGAGVNMEDQTGPEGQAEFDVLPTKPGKIIIRLLGEYKTVNPEVIEVIAPTSAPTITFEEYEELTEDSEVTITGFTTADATVTINGKPISVGADGKFFINADLIEGLNEFEVTATNPVGTSTTQIVKITRDTKPPVVKVSPPAGRLINASEAEVVVEVDEKATVELAGKIYNLEKGTTKITLPVVLGNNTYNIKATDTLGHKTTITFELRNYQITTVQLKIGNAAMLVNGEIVILDSPPYIAKTNRTLVPVRAISQAFGAEVGWDGTARRVTVTLEDIKLQMTIGSTTAILNSKFVQIDQAPEITNGRTMVPFRFIAESLGAEVDWNGDEKLITMTRYH